MECTIHLALLEGKVYILSQGKKGASNFNKKIARKQPVETTTSAESEGRKIPKTIDLCFVPFSIYPAGNYYSLKTSLEMCVAVIALQNLMTPEPCECLSFGL